MRFNVIPTNTFDVLQVDAGVLLKHFDIQAAAQDSDATGFDDDDIITATTGGINPVCTPQYSDWGEDVDNVPVNMKELKHLDGWDCSISTTALGTTADKIKFALGAADVDDTSDVIEITPRAKLKDTDFGDVWWVGERPNGGFLAIQLKNALSTGGFSLQTGKNAKGTIPLTITGHVSVNAQNEVPMKFYSLEPIAETEPATEPVTEPVTEG